MKYILNHSCKVELDIQKEFEAWTRNYFNENEVFGSSEYKLCKLLHPTEEDDSVVFVIQLFCEMIVCDDEKFELHQDQFMKALFEQFNTKALSFISIMQLVD